MLSEERSPKGPTPSTVEIELDRFAEYLRESLGLAAATVLGHTRQLRRWLCHAPFALASCKIEGFHAAFLLADRTSEKLLEAM